MVFDVISSNYLYFNLLENAERTARYVELFWMEVFVQQKLKLLDLLWDFGLIIILELIND